MNVLVAVASKHGSTREIGEAIARALAERGIAVDVRDVGEIEGVERYDAVVLGSAVYVGRWMPEAVRFVEEHRAVLAEKPVWLFSSGPIGDPPKPTDETVDADRVASLLGAREHRTFAGRLAPSELGLRERLVVKVVHAAAGDFRAWDEIRAWGAGIGEALTPATVG